jgi:hypothetical protein
MPLMTWSAEPTRPATKQRNRRSRDKPFVGHVLDRRHRKGKVQVPEEKKATVEVPESYQKELQQLGQNYIR